MTWWQIALLAWAGVGLLFFVGINLAIRSEPTAHGQAMGCQMSLAMLVAWPIILPALIVNGVRNAIAARRHKKWVAEFERRRERAA